MSGRIVLGLIRFAGAERVPFELRDGHWSCDDPDRRLHWHDGPYESDGQSVRLRATADSPVAMELVGLDINRVGHGDCGNGILRQAADESTPPSSFDWEITAVVD